MMTIHVDAGDYSLTGRDAMGERDGGGMMVVVKDDGGGRWTKRKGWGRCRGISVGPVKPPGPALPFAPHGALKFPALCSPAPRRSRNKEATANLLSSCTASPRPASVHFTSPLSPSVNPAVGSHLHFTSSTGHVV